MYYDNFDKHITEVYGVVVENWPSAEFMNPSKLRSQIEIQVVYDAFHSGSACFKKLNKEEFHLWKEKRNNASGTSSVDGAGVVDSVNVIRGGTMNAGIGSAGMVDAGLIINLQQPVNPGKSLLYGVELA